MFFQGKIKNRDEKGIKQYFRSNAFQITLIGTITIILVCIIVINGAMPKKYNIKLGDVSKYDITAPRDIENTVMTEQKALAAAEAVEPAIIRLDNVVIDVLNNLDEFFTVIEIARDNIVENLKAKGISETSNNYQENLQQQQELAIDEVVNKVNALDIPLSREQTAYIVTKSINEELKEFEKISKKQVSNIMKLDINSENLANMIDTLQNNIQGEEINQEMKNIGILLSKAVLKPNSIVDVELTEERREEEYNSAMENKEIILKDSRIISYGDTITEDKLQVLKELGLLETGRFEYTYAAGIIVIMLMLSVLLFLYMRRFCKNVLNNKNSIILLCVITLLTLLTARFVYTYSPLVIPIFLAAMLISIFLDLKLAIIVNLILTIAITFMVKGHSSFIYMAIISGSISAFVVEKANQRSKLSAAGIIIAGINTLIIVCMGAIDKSTVKTIASNSLLVSINGIVSIILTIGMLPFLESTFSIITPLKLLELANPNQPLIKKLLVEAPGTYHHSLMVGNLAEMATGKIGGNALLARVGAYFHDIGKLKRPGFFKENQMSDDNPHDKMTPNLSTLVITSHTNDGLEMAEKSKIPLAVREIISQHHGTTLVAYFYHKAKQDDKGEVIKHDDFRYEGPKPTTKESAVVMLADSVEAAVRSMADKTEGKIEGLVRKIIKDKLDDGQLDLCDLTLRDLDNIAKGFMQVFSGYFHKREEYPDIEGKINRSEERKALDPIDIAISQNK